MIVINLPFGTEKTNIKNMILLIIVETISNQIWITYRFGSFRKWKKRLKKIVLYYASDITIIFMKWNDNVMKTENPWQSESISLTSISSWFLGLLWISDNAPYSLHILTLKISSPLDILYLKISDPLYPKSFTWGTDNFWKISLYT